MRCRALSSCALSCNVMSNLSGCVMSCQVMSRLVLLCCVVLFCVK